MKHAAVHTLADRVLSRPPILEATRAIGLTDAQLARLIGCTPPQVNDWVKGRKPIPGIKHHALLIFVAELAGVIDDNTRADTVYARRARLLHGAIQAWLGQAIEEGAMAAPIPGLDAGQELADRMLAKLEEAIAA